MLKLWTQSRTRGAAGGKSCAEGTDFRQQTTFVFTGCTHNQNLEGLSLETVLTVLYTKHHILVSMLFINLHHVSVQLKLTPLSRSRVWYAVALH